MDCVHEYYIVEASSRHLVWGCTKCDYRQTIRPNFLLPIRDNKRK